MKNSWKGEVRQRVTADATSRVVRAGNTLQPPSTAVEPTNIQPTLNRLKNKQEQLRREKTRGDLPVGLSSKQHARARVSGVCYKPLRPRCRKPNL